MKALAAVRRRVNVSGIEVSYWEWNRGQEPLLLLHGLADCAAVWASLGEDLAPNYHIVAPDLRGHGDSSKPPKGYRFVDFISDLEALMQHLGWSCANALAHSWSAKLLTIWATEHPERFRSLILVDPFSEYSAPQLVDYHFANFVPSLAVSQDDEDFYQL